jgi:hypothetical protein
MNTDIGYQKSNTGANTAQSLFEMMYLWVLPPPRQSCTHSQSRRSHETGLKHSGNKERFIRDLYRNGNKAKIEKAEEAVQIARIEAVRTLC